MSPITIAIVWAAVGALGGWLVRWGSVKLARLEELESGHAAWQVYGPTVLAAVLFAALGFQLAASLPLLLLDSVFLLVFVQVIFFDFEHRLILDRVIFPTAALALVASLFTQPWWAGLASGLGAGAAFVLIGLGASLLLRADALGFGDAKLAALIGVVLGPAPTLQALLAGVVLAGLFATGYAIWRRSMKGNIALGPFLALGAVFAMLRI